MRYRSSFRLLLLVALLSTPLLTRAAQGLPALEQLAAKGYSVAGLVVDLGTESRIAGFNADKLLTPASITKLYVAAKALEIWGSDYRFETDVLVQGQRQGTRLQGNLVLRGGGDPSLTNEGLWRLARDIAQHGIKQISGDLIVDESRFGHVPCVTIDRCEAEKSSWHSYDALLSSAVVNYSNIAVVVAPSEQIGDTARISVDPYPIPNIEVHGSIQTAKGYGAHYKLSRITDDTGDSLKVSGTIGVNAGVHRSYRSVGRPALFTGRLFREFLRAADISVAGDVRVSRVPVEGERLTSYQGEPLNKIIDDMLYYSNNLIADVLTLNIRVELAPQAPVNLPFAGGELQRYARETTSAGPYADASGARLFDGSGLNPDNRLAPVDLVSLLASVYRRSQDFPFLIGALRVPAQSPSRGLSGGAELLERMSIKTGGLSEPVTVNTLAGYLRFKDGGWGAFAMMVNGTTEHRHISRSEAFAAMRKDLEAMNAKVCPCG